MERFYSCVADLLCSVVPSHRMYFSVRFAFHMITTQVRERRAMAGGPAAHRQVGGVSIGGAWLTDVNDLVQFCY